MSFDEETFGPVNKKASRLRYLSSEMQILPQRCVVIGDAEKDLKGAREAGMRFIAVPNEFTLNNDFSLADAVYQHPSEITINALRKTLLN